VKISVIILAAGGSKRMGEPNKLLLLIDGKPMIHSVCKMVLGARVNQVVLVTGYQSNKIEKSIPEGINTIVHNRKWESGMMSSICAGMSRLDKDVEGNMIVLGDMPLISTITINRIIKEFNKHSGKHIIYPEYNNRQANPVIFPRKYFPEILKSKGDNGCKKVLKKYPGNAVGIPINTDEVIIDCDTRDDYLLIEKKLLNNVKT
tara:strand:+ start:34 stop:645 length:612 start_codon:yes stop_codon:yes gene_type:complete